MGKDKSEKKDKKEKKEKRAEVDGVKKVKKEKKDKSSKEKSDKAVDAILKEAKKAEEAIINGTKGGDEDEEAELKVIPKEALVPFANPLADEKQTKKTLKAVKRGMRVLMSLIHAVTSTNMSYV
jgi:H/ACA ribonucleoprotein complex subunit 2